MDITNSYEKESYNDETVENEKLKKTILKLTKIIENKNIELLELKKQIDDLVLPPYFIGTIIERINDNVVVKLHGSNQEIVTSYKKNIENKIIIGSRALLNSAYHIVNIIDKAVDYKANSMLMVESPNINYSMIGGLKQVIQEVIESVELPLTNPSLFESVGVIPPSGVLLYGPPGTGKTLIARAVATRTNSTFIKMNGSDLVQKFVGEGARLVKDIFNLARIKAPSILFIDEIDAVGSIRSLDGTSGSSEVNRTMIQLLSEMDGFDKRNNIKIIAATNRIDLLDPALLRPGRFDRKIEVPMPNKEDRIEILKIHTKTMNLEKNINFDELGELTFGFNGADLNSVAVEAGMFAIRSNEKSIKYVHFLKAIEKLKQKNLNLNLVDTSMFG